MNVSEVEAQLRDELYNERHESSRLRIKIADYEKIIQRLNDANERMADRNWELQQRVFECTKMTGT